MLSHSSTLPYSMAWCMHVHRRGPDSWIRIKAIHSLLCRLDTFGSALLSMIWVRHSNLDSVLREFDVFCFDDSGLASIQKPNFPHVCTSRWIGIFQRKLTVFNKTLSNVSFPQKSPEIWSRSHALSSFFLYVWWKMLNTRGRSSECKTSESGSLSRKCAVIRFSYI